jgi:hypothetical protein
MTRGKKILLAVGVLATIGLGIAAVVYYRRKDKLTDDSEVMGRDAKRNRIIEIFNPKD